MRALFLDRDGVINVEKDGSYIFSPAELKYYPGSLEAISKAKNHFDLILVVTNQRGIGRGLMTERDLFTIHEQINTDLTPFNVQIDRFYFAPGIDANDNLRKPNTGMGLQAKSDYPEIDFSKSVMIGNNISDVQFGKSLGMQTVFLYTTQDMVTLPHPLIDVQFADLQSWANSL